MAWSHFRIGFKAVEGKKPQGSQGENKDGSREGHSSPRASLALLSGFLPTAATLRFANSPHSRYQQNSSFPSETLSSFQALLVSTAEHQPPPQHKHTWSVTHVFLHTALCGSHPQHRDVFILQHVAQRIHSCTFFHKNGEEY